MYNNFSYKTYKAITIIKLKKKKLKKKNHIKLHIQRKCEIFIYHSEIFTGKINLTT